MRRFWTLGVAAWLGCGSALAAGAPQVATDRGPVTGLVNGGVAEYLGIPYAAPPTGHLRFRPPQPHAAWSAPLEATKFGNPCPQTPRLGSGSTNEDCLVLNVFAPAEHSSQRPVMVFIHGGSFNAGSGGVTTPNGPDYSGNDIVAQSGALVVTLNYRVGALGFLAAPALDAEDGRNSSGNYGLLDQQAALGEPATGEPRRGDLVFLPGHVGIMASATDVLHANAHWMRVVTEPLADTLARQPEGRGISAVRRLA